MCEEFTRFSRFTHHFIRRSKMEKKELWTEFTREKSDVLLERRYPLPAKQDRPMAELKWEASLDDLEALVEIAIKAGEEVAERAGKPARTEAKVIATDQIVLDERARWKCIIPLCFGYGSSPMCPPYSPTTEEMKGIISKYKYGVFLRYMPPISDHVYPDFLGYASEHVNELNEIVSIVETEAGYMGYYFAMGFKGGPCCLCGVFLAKWVGDFFVGKDVPRCPVLDGKICYHYTRPRPALEACGVDVFSTARNVGWKTYLILPEHPEEAVPCVSWYGLVLVA
jgi:predicted metal-binding protein